ncbi:TIGR04282 family arsenosugar biosynthesis glycosyltransferase [Zobellia alginiliquefaciens]|uniref:TIGR04282 family arsenosugar biosynthesis glycosyltransferase n=1 Tax=Zobellia alginiliquefaciens TaxID=3032586 RepID=UPI0023E3971E|nr:DUF2064 domain-containing protein [Zobellia alginiliquefaciens]
MGQKNKDTAILVFSLSAQLEAERKSLFGKRNKNASKGFFDILIKRTHTIASAAHADVVVFDESQQRGKTFGDRYANAFQELFDLGYRKVLSIGNDTPDLTSEVLEQAVDRIQHNDMVVGPSTDGGIYLLGMRREFFNINEFKALPWLQSTLFHTLVNGVFWKKAKTYYFDELSDIDTAHALHQFLYTTEDAILIEFILNHLSFRTNPAFCPKALFHSNKYSYSFQLRGPPAFSVAA